jgi:hypothetical protein
MQDDMRALQRQWRQLRLVAGLAMMGDQDGVVLVRHAARLAADQGYYVDYIAAVAEVAATRAGLPRNPDDQGRPS